MCGIFGAVNLSGDAAVPRVDVWAALRAIRHRGPDGQGIHEMPGAVLGHVRLAILDLTSAAAQPMVSVDGRHAVVFNGEIYNHHEVRAELRASGVPFRSRGDTEVLLEGYRAWGPAVVEKVDGMFAFGIYDSRDRSLFLATDRAGKKPLFWAQQGGLLWFASEIKALLAAGFPTEPETAALPYLLSFGYVPSPGTLYRGVRSLPPASSLLLHAAKQPNERCYYRAPFDEPRSSDSLELATAEVRSRFVAAVAKRLEADVPIGAFLSGGVDSTLVVGVMSRLLGKKVRTFSIGFSGDARYDETPYARTVSRIFATDHVEFTLEPASFDLVERLVRAYDGPFGDSSAIPTSVVSMLTREHVTVAVTGDGGDELFCGYPRMTAGEAAEYVPPPLRKTFGAVAGSLRHHGPASSERMLRLVANFCKPLPSRVHSWTTFFDEDLARMLRPEVRGTVAPLAFTLEAFSRHANAPLLARILAHNYETYLPFDLLVKADRCSMAHSLELRSPFLDTQLVDYAARLPAHFLRRRRTRKWILKRAFADILPASVATRTKMGFGLPLDSWFRNSLKDYVRDMLRPSAKLTSWIEPAFIADLLGAHMTGRANHGMKLWLLLTIEVWLQQDTKWSLFL